MKTMGGDLSIRLWRVGQQYRKCIVWNSFANAGEIVRFVKMRVINSTKIKLGPIVVNDHRLIQQESQPRLLQRRHDLNEIMIAQHPE